MWPLAQPTAAILGFLDGTDDEVGARTAKGGSSHVRPVALLCRHGDPLPEKGPEHCLPVAVRLAATL